MAAGLASAASAAAAIDACRMRRGRVDEVSENTAQKIAALAIDLRRTHPAAPAQDVLDLAFQGQAVDGLCFDAEATHPGSPFGQVIAAAFGGVTTPAQWREWTSPAAAPGLRDGILQVWAQHVIPRFSAAYGFGVGVEVDEAVPAADQREAFLAEVRAFIKRLGFAP